MGRSLASYRLWVIGDDKEVFGLYCDRETVLGEDCEGVWG